MEGHEQLARAKARWREVAARPGPSRWCGKNTEGAAGRSGRVRARVHPGWQHRRAVRSSLCFTKITRLLPGDEIHHREPGREPVTKRSRMAACPGPGRRAWGGEGRGRGLADRGGAATERPDVEGRGAVRGDFVFSCEMSPTGREARLETKIASSGL